MNRRLFCSCLFILLYCPLFAQEKYSVKDYLGQTNITGITVSPNGKYVVAVSVQPDFSEDKMSYRLWRFRIDKNLNLTEKVLLDDELTNYAQFKWTDDDSELFFIASSEKGRKLYRLGMSGGSPQPLKPTAKGTLYLLDQMDNQHLLLGYSVTHPDKKAEKIYGKAIRTDNADSATTVFYRFSVAKESADSLFAINRLLSSAKVSPDKTKLLVTTRANEVYSAIQNIREEEIEVFDLKTGQRLHRVTQNHAGESAVWIDSENIAGGIDGDLESPTYSPVQLKLFKHKLGEKQIRVTNKDFAGRITAYQKTPDGNMVFTADVSTRNHFFTLDLRTDKIEQKTSFTGSISAFDCADNTGVVAFAMTTADAFEEVYVAKSVSALPKAQKISDFNAKLTRLPKPHVEKVAWKNSDGETIEGVLFWPPGKKGAANLPFAVDLHGGPWSLRHETISLNSLQYYYYASLLASHGFLVLQPNYRGGMGRGDAFMLSINGQPLSKPTDDVITGVQSLMKQGWVNKDKMLVMGASYGGLLTNAVIGQTTDFELALSSCGTWNELMDGISDNNHSRTILFNGQRPWDNYQNYWKESAAAYVKNIKTPTLITFGEADKRVPPAQGYAMHRALRETGVPSELVLFPGEGHLYRKPSNMLGKMRIELNWIRKYLGIDIPVD